MSADIKNLKNLQNTEYSLKKLFDDAEDLAECGSSEGKSWLEQTARLAYCIMLQGITGSLNKINREAA